ncbi:MAG: hypothetical protein JWQ74_1333 [Marmoricola sp.]|nr:hypothetical protein [Marmoricola sp.]
MTDEKLTELLERAAERVPVSPAPLAEITDGARRGRRRRAAQATCGVSAVIAATIVGTALTVGSNHGGSPGRTTPAPAVVPASGMRLVALGHAAIAVPESWGTNEASCGTPVKNTVIIGGGDTDTCRLAVTPRVDSVELDQGRPGYPFKATGAVTVDGVAAERQATTCPPVTTRARYRPCTGAVYLPSLDTSFSAAAPSAARVDAILARIQVLPDRVGVPNYVSFANEGQGHSRAQYAAALRALGLRVAVKTEQSPGITPGFIVGASPAGGTVLKPGDTVTITEVAEPRGPADQVEVHLNAADPTNHESGIDGLDNAQVAADPTIKVLLGKGIWSYAFGKWSKTFSVRLTGDALVRRGSPGDTNYPNTWVAKHPGRSTLTLTIVAHGRTVTLGTVTVVVTAP